MAWLKDRNKDKYKRKLLNEENRATGLLNFILALSIAAVAYTDWIVVENDSLGYLYVLPIALSALVNRFPVTITLSLLCAYLQDVFGPPSDTLHVRIVRGLISLAGYLIVGFLVTRIVQQRGRLAAEIRQERDDYERDLTLAAQVQRQVLPKPPIMPGIDLAAAMQTAHLLGGDYYDFYPISENIMDVVIADVSGKGAAASLLMPSLAVALRLRARELSGPAAIIKDLDGILKQITTAATFVTVFYARFNPTERTLQYASGGFQQGVSAGLQLTYRFNENANLRADIETANNVRRLSYQETHGRGADAWRREASMHSLPEVHRSIDIPADGSVWRKMLAFAFDGIMSFSILPLRLSTYLGAFVGIASVLYGVIAVICHLAGLTQPGWTTTVVLVSFLFSVQLLMTGLLGEYVGRIYEQVKMRPLYVVAERVRHKPMRKSAPTEDYGSLGEVAPSPPPLPPRALSGAPPSLSSAPKKSDKT